jgi:predicted N-formylglutamate amidohydrolase
MSAKSPDVKAREHGFERIPLRSPAGVVLICDHASNRVPVEYGHLGVDEGILGTHIAWDIGAGDLTRRLSALLGAGAILSVASRLVIDCNRPPGHESSIPSQSHGIPIPGNIHLPPGDTQQREQQFFHPYQSAVDEELRSFEAEGVAPALISVHSFTPELEDVARPWHIGILSDRDRRLADAVLATFNGDRRWVLGDNEPYSGSYPEGYSCRHHGDAAKRINVTIEVRQDLIETPEDAEEVAAALAPRIRHAVGVVGDAGDRVGATASGVRQ